MAQSSYGGRKSRRMEAGTVTAEGSRQQGNRPMRISRGVLASWRLGRFLLSVGLVSRPRNPRETSRGSRRPFPPVLSVTVIFSTVCPAESVRQADQAAGRSSRAAAAGNDRAPPGRGYRPPPRPPYSARAAATRTSTEGLVRLLWAREMRISQYATEFARGAGGEAGGSISLYCPNPLTSWQMATSATPAARSAPQRFRKLLHFLSHAAGAALGRRRGLTKWRSGSRPGAPHRLRSFDQKRAAAAPLRSPPAIARSTRQVELATERRVFVRVGPTAPETPAMTPGALRLQPAYWAARLVFRRQ